MVRLATCAGLQYSMFETLQNTTRSIVPCRMSCYSLKLLMAASWLELSFEKTITHHASSCRFLAAESMNEVVAKS